LNIGFWWGNLREREHFENLDVDEWIILKEIVNKYNWGLHYIDVDWTSDRPL
jgi:hypothetical protein